MSNYNHETYMRYAIDLAKRAEGHTLTNPMVGACIVLSDRVIGFGWHTKYGFAHAEVEAFNSVDTNWKHQLHESTLYVTLEPCNHYGKTPPCTSLIIENGIKHVVVGCLDPNPLVAGSGIEKLRNHGIKVTVGVLEETCKKLIKPFTTGILLQRPYIHLKWAQSSNGKIGKTGKRTTISNPLTLRWGHLSRAKNNGILVGYNTVKIDDPELTVRYVCGENPTRVVIDLNNTLSTDYKIFNSQAPTIVIHSGQDKMAPHQQVQYHSIPFLTDNEANFWEQAMNFLYKNRIGTLLVEGGTKTHLALIKNNLWDKISIIKSPIEIEEGIQAPDLPEYATLIESNPYGDNRIETYINQH